MRLIFTVFSMIFSLNLFAASSYVGQEHRSLKSLSDKEINGFLNGKGMGFAKPAELNNYPGPKHVLDLSNKLNLDNSQIEKTKYIFKNMQVKSIEYGKLLINNEMEIENLFNSGAANPEALNNLLIKSATLNSKIRYAHLAAHIQQRNLLSKHQIYLYNELRGYSGDEHKQPHKHNH